MTLKILELTTEERCDDIYVKCIFQVPLNDEMFRVFRWESLEYRVPNTVLVDPEDYATYLYEMEGWYKQYQGSSSLDLLFSDDSPTARLFSKDKCLVDAHAHTLLKYDTVNNTFTFREYFDKNNTVRGAIKDLELLEQGIDTSVFVKEAQLLRLLKTLDLHWN